jgi:hypothetical protein
MAPAELVETALRVLVAWNSGRRPDPLDVFSLKKAFPALANAADDALACQVIHDLSSVAFPREIRSADSMRKRVDDVA